MEQELEFVERQVGATADLTVIWLHGLGADGYDFVPLVPELRLPFGVRFLFPHAPVQPVTLNGGMRMRAWYDLYGLSAGVREDAAGLDASAARVRALLDAEVARGQPENRAALREPRENDPVLGLTAGDLRVEQRADARGACVEPRGVLADARA